MNKIYLLAPLAGMSVFGGVYTKYARQHETQLAETRRQEALVKTEKLAAEETAKTKALEGARMSQSKREHERSEKTREEEARKETRRVLEERRTLAIEESGRLRPQVAMLRRELTTLAADVARGEQRKQQLEQDEHAALEATRRAEQQRDALAQLMQRLPPKLVDPSPTAPSATDPKPKPRSPRPNEAI
jgi:hypothetical protein